MTLPLRDQFLGREVIRDPIGCSLAFVTLPMRVRALSFINAEVSISGARIRFRTGSPASGARLLPFSDAVNLLESMAEGKFRSSGEMSDCEDRGRRCRRSAVEAAVERTVEVAV